MYVQTMTLIICHLSPYARVHDEKRNSTKCLLLDADILNRGQYRATRHCQGLCQVNGLSGRTKWLSATFEVILRPFESLKWDLRASEPDEIPVEWPGLYHSPINLTTPMAGACREIGPAGCRLSGAVRWHPQMHRESERAQPPFTSRKGKLLKCDAVASLEAGASEPHGRRHRPATNGVMRLATLHWRLPSAMRSWPPWVWLARLRSMPSATARLPGYVRVGCRGTSSTVDAGSLGLPPQARRSSGITCSAKRYICSSTSSPRSPGISK